MQGAFSSVVERSVHIGEVAGPIPATPTSEDEKRPLGEPCGRVTLRRLFLRLWVGIHVGIPSPPLAIFFVQLFSAMNTIGGPVRTSWSFTASGNVARRFFSHRLWVTPPPSPAASNARKAFAMAGARPGTREDAPPEVHIRTDLPTQPCPSGATPTYQSPFPPRKIMSSFFFPSSRSRSSVK